MAVTLVLGGVRSGKSARAESLLPESARYVATAAAQVGVDDEFRSRIATHRARRPAGWTTVETADVAELLGSEPYPATLVDDLGGWLTAVLDSAAAWETPDDVLPAAIGRLVAAVSEYPGDLVLVSSEVGLSLVPTTPAGRVFQDGLGALNAAVAAVADRVELVVAGNPVTVKALGPADDASPASAVVLTKAETAAAVGAATGPASAAEAGSIAPAAPEPVPLPEHSDDPLRFPPLVAPDAEVVAQARERHSRLTKPIGSLGRLEDLGVWATACQGACPPKAFERPRVVVFAGDHGVAASGVSAYPPEVTAQMVANFSAGGAAVNVLAAQAGATVRVEDIAVSVDTGPELSRHKVRHSSGDIAHEDALSDAEAVAAISVGRAIADDEIDSGADLLIAGDMGIGNTTPSAVLIGLLTDHEPVVVVGRGTGIDDNAWMRKAAAVRDAMWRGRPYARDPKSLLRTVGGADLAAMAGFLAQAAVRRTPVVLDGVVVTAAALVAQDLAPGAVEWWRAGHLSSEPAHALALAQLGLEPMLTFDMRLGEGSGAALALPIVQSAVSVLASMATFDEAGVSEG
ncbi:nicotinate-nucleotide--dimethylbenzimidazole phosphoribosyltransferase [Tsukamurella sp. 8F]|uniref:nicotinate-nucleotide--dimethylbenzimidazole phosphoribosyltransferase n=1 Tax=unclassified Tsukamurella TaxID=2633480 RepID=UPI0023B9AECF|nr:MULTISPECIES: nicotinate-nucleotide--dimethylbenzimidazole phosphoribosyltransferase [unclassified Tsukamurella]MDF0529912.1 nicotinate-nucleotide--dimethylbenzimidazole phosphoribosyltransferase [Tsukamurella sp. 8J]MDF0587316.1 nicotinate-nucleotide--dimethylbenzimidazole phosphoribosyltransferase [Tsukamurella sp. 8F]